MALLGTFGYGSTGAASGGGGYASPFGGLAPVGAAPVSVQDADSRRMPPGGSGMWPLPGAHNIYNQLLGLNVQNYNNTLGAFAQGQANLAPNLANIQAGYYNLNQRIRNDLGVGGDGWGVALPGANAIQEQFAKSRGEITQNMINSGLGNSTVTAALQNQNSLMAGRAYGELAANLANTAAGYAAQVGLAQQQAAMQGLGMQSSMYEGLGRTLGGYQFANTAGQLYGNYSYSPPGSGGGGGGGGYRGGGGGGGSGYQDVSSGPSYHAPDTLGYAGANQPSYYNPYPSYGASGAVAQGGGGFDWGGVGSSASSAAGGWGDVTN